jgi:uncharacterized membrane protein YccC
VAENFEETRPPASCGTLDQAFWPSYNRLALAQFMAGLRSVAPALLFGLRLWASVCLALYIAFWLQLDNAYWAGASAATVCQPSLGASLRKGWFRVVGTAVGAMAIVVLTACFPQDRAGFLLGLAFWGAVCGLVATLLRNFASYAAALAGVTAAVIASDELGAVGGLNGDAAFLLAVTRASEICIGIICAGVVLAATDFGGARQRLAMQLATISAEIAGRLAGTFLLVGPEQSKGRPVRRDLIRHVTALDPVIDEALGESSDLRPHSPALQAAVGGLFAALSGWRTAAVHLELLRGDLGRREAAIVLESIPPELRSMRAQGEAADWSVDPSKWRKACASAVRTLTILPTNTPSLRLLADRAAEALIGIRRALDGLLLLVNPAEKIPTSRPAWFSVPDRLPALVNAARIFVTIGAIELFWIATAWPGGATAIVFAAIATIVFSPRADLAYSTAIGFLVGASLAAALAAIVKFSVLPNLATFAGFCLAIGLVLVPAGMLLAQRQSPMLMAMVVVFLPLLQPANQTSYDTQQFYNAALAIVVGVGAAAFAFRLLPPLSPTLRIRRLLALTLRDLRRLTSGPIPRTVHGWERRIYGRLSAMPEQAEPLQRAQLLAALTVGAETIRLRRVARRFDQKVELDAALDAVARGDGIVAIEHLDRLDRMLAAGPATRPGGRVRLRARGSLLAISEALAQHTAYFSSGAA